MRVNAEREGIGMKEKENGKTEYGANVYYLILVKEIYILLLFFNFILKGT